MAAEKDLYERLGVKKDASAKDIRRAYHKLARTHHPDLNPGDRAAEERFKEMSAAYEVLADADKRALYDEFGHAGIRQGFDPQQARSHQRWSAGQQRAGQHSGDAGVDFDLSDMFGDMFGGGKRRADRPRRGHDIGAVVEIDFSQALRGAEVQFQAPSRVACAACAGSGTQAQQVPQTCPDCAGSGHTQAVQGPMRMRVRCHACRGTGKLGPACRACGGNGKKAQIDTVTVRIPPGADNGSKLRVPGHGEPGALGGPTGDLVLETRVRPHPFFAREGLDLILRLPVSLDEAYNGAAVEVPTASGKVTLRIPPRSQQGARLRLRGKGVSRGETTGDLYVDLDVRMPDGDDPKVAEAVRLANAAYTQPLRDAVRL